MSALGGNLEDFGIAEIFQLIGQQRKTGTLLLSTGAERIEIQFDRGAVVCAGPVGDFPGAALAEMLVRCGYAEGKRVEVLRQKSLASAETIKGLAVEDELISKEEIDELESLLTKESLFDLLQWTTGSFDFKPGDVGHERANDLMMGAEQILMDSLSISDEWLNLADSIPPEDTVFGKTSAFGAETGQALRLNPRFSPEKAERVSQLIDGRASVRRVIDLSRVGTFEAMQVIVALRQAGMIQAVTPPRKRRTASLPLRKHQLRGALAAILLDRGVQRQQVGLLSNRRDDFDDLADLVARFAQILDCHVGSFGLLDRLLRHRRGILHVLGDFTKRGAQFFRSRGNRFDVLACLFTG